MAPRLTAPVKVCKPVVLNIDVLIAVRPVDPAAFVTLRLVNAARFPTVPLKVMVPPLAISKSCAPLSVEPKVMYPVVVLVSAIPSTPSVTAPV